MKFQWKRVNVDNNFRKKNSAVIRTIYHHSTEAEAYINLLETEGVKQPVDRDVDSYKMMLPEWYDPNLFKRLVVFAFQMKFAVAMLQLLVNMLNNTNLYT